MATESTRGPSCRTQTGKIGIDWTIFAINCTGFRATLPCNMRIPAVKRPRFESPILHSAGLHHLAPGRKPLQNRGFLMRGQFGLRPTARQYGRLLTLLLTPFWRALPHRPGEVVFDDLEAVLRNDRLGAADSVTDHLDRELVGQFRLASTPQDLKLVRNN